VVQTNNSLKTINLILLLFESGLLLLDCVDEDNVNAVVPDAFDLAFGIAKSQKRFNLLDILGAEPEIATTVRLPCEADRTQTIDDLQSGDEWFDLRLVTEARRRASANPVVAVEAELGAARDRERIYLQLAGNDNRVVSSASTQYDGIACGNYCECADGSGKAKIVSAQVRLHSDNGVVVPSSVNASGLSTEK
jgi:hypothetical protein